CGDVAQDLVVGAVFLDDVDDVLEDGGLADVLRNRDRRDARLALLGGGEDVGDARVGADLFGVAGEGRRVRALDARDGAAVVVGVPGLAGFEFRGVARADAFYVGDPDPFPRARDGAGVPAGGDEAG